MNSPPTGSHEVVIGLLRLAVLARLLLTNAAPACPQWLSDPATKITSGRIN